MGVAHADLVAVLKLRQKGELPKRFAVADIGAQQLSNSVTADQRLLTALAKAFEVEERRYIDVVSKSSLSGAEHLPETAPSAKELWEWLGCEYTAIDIDTSPHVVPLDLNFDNVPRHYRGQFALVMNLGTTEHIANQLQAMKVIHDLTKLHGIMIHNVPMQGYTNHGMINYNPKFFWMLARSCRYRWLDIRLSISQKSAQISPDIISELRRYDEAGADAATSLRTTDTSLSLTLQKNDDISFVAPIDMHVGGVVEDARIRERYWTVFNQPPGRASQVRRYLSRWLR
jgi:hypothetical protein